MTCFPHSSLTLQEQLTLFRLFILMPIVLQIKRLISFWAERALYAGFTGCYAEGSADVKKLLLPY